MFSSVFFFVCFSLRSSLSPSFLYLVEHYLNQAQKFFIIHLPTMINAYRDDVHEGVEKRHVTPKNVVRNFVKKRNAQGMKRKRLDVPGRYFRIGLNPHQAKMSSSLVAIWYFPVSNI